MVHTLDNKLPEVGAERSGDTLGDVEAEALVDTLASTLLLVESETVSDTLGDVEAAGALMTHLAMCRPKYW